MRPPPAPSTVAPSILSTAESAALFDPPSDHVARHARLRRDEAARRCSLTSDDIAGAEPTAAGSQPARLHGAARPRA